VRKVAEHVACSQKAISLTCEVTDAAQVKG